MSQNKWFPCESHEWLKQCQAAIQLPGQAVEKVLAWRWAWKMGPIGCPETSVTNYQSTCTLRNIPEEWRFHFHRGGSLKSRNWVFADGSWPISAPLNLDAVSLRPILRIYQITRPPSSAEVCAGLKLYLRLPLCLHRHVMGWPHPLMCAIPIHPTSSFS